MGCECGCDTEFRDGDRVVQIDRGRVDFDNENIEFDYYNSSPQFLLEDCFEKMYEHWVKRK
jgi:hypothetical protein